MKMETTLVQLKQISEIVDCDESCMTFRLKLSNWAN